MANEKGTTAPEHPEVLSTAQVGEFLGIHEVTATKLLAAGKLPGRKIGGQWRVLRKNLEAFLSEQAS